MDTPRSASAPGRASGGRSSRGARAGGQAEPGQLEQTLANCAKLRASGVLQVTGEPGGVVHLDDGKITAISTPGAPDAEVILLRSGRVPEAGWSAVFSAAAADGGMGAELVKRQLIGVGELEALLRTALADAMFALTAGQVQECRLEEETAGSLLPLDPPADPQWLLAEASRRLKVLAGQASPIAHDRDRVTTVPGAWKPRVGPGDGQAEIVALANGRRTARDMAFVLGRGVYAVTLQLARMCDAGLLMIGSSRIALPQRGTDPDTAPVPAQQPEASPSGEAPPLPRRRRGATGQPAGKQQEKTSVLRILRPGSGSGASEQPGGQAP
jgi:hypothetical protein